MAQTQAPKTVFDGFTSLMGGMHGGVDSALLAESLYARGENVTCRDGVIQTRPSFAKLYDLPDGTFQGAGRWSLNGGDRIVTVVSGRVYSMKVSDGSLIDHGLKFSPTVTRCSFTQVDKWLAVQDGVSAPFVLQESASGVAEAYSAEHPTVPCITPGKVMAYVHGRIHYSPTKLPALTPVITDVASKDVVPADMAVTGRTSFVSSDVLDLYNPEYVFRMAEHRVLDTGGAARLPQEIGFITAMAAFRNASTGSGVGALILFGREGVCAFDVSTSRAQWTTTNVSQVLFYGSGTISPMSVVALNDDLVYIDTDGNMRTVRYTKTQTAGNGGSLSNVAMSFELTPFIMQQAEGSLPAVSTCVADNRCLFTLAGTQDGLYRGLGVLDAAKFASISGAQAPTYDGAWSSFVFQQVLTVRKNDKWLTAAVVKGLRRADANTLIALDYSLITDMNTDPVRSVVWTRAMNFGSATDLKVLSMLELWLSDIQRDTTVSVYYRPRGYHKWWHAGTKTVRVPAGSYSQVRRRLHFPVVAETTGCDPATKERFMLANDFQFAIVWTGRSKLDRFLATATLQLEPPAACATEQSVTVDDSSPGVVLNDFSYVAVGA